MPELPEVEVVRRGLDSWVVGRTIERARVLDARSVRRHQDGPQDFEISLSGATVSAAVRRGKFLWLPLRAVDPLPDAAAGVALVAHLGMSGQLLVEDSAQPQEKHLKVSLDLAPAPGEGAVAGKAGATGAAAGARQLRFVDQRIFGGMWLSPLIPTPDGGPGGRGSDAASFPADAAHIARDVLDPLTTASALRASWKTRRVSVKTAILDQSLLAGVGNIYADEALWRTRLHYLTPVASLSLARTAELLQALRDVMGDALAAGGTSFDALYVNVNGASGYFDRSLNAYGQQGKPCSRCGTLMVRESFMNRGSHFCPTCQRRR